MPAGIQHSTMMIQHDITTHQSFTPKLSKFLRSVFLIENEPVHCMTSDFGVLTSGRKTESIIAEVTKDNISRKKWIKENVIDTFVPETVLTHRVEGVDEKTFNNLKKAQDAIWLAKSLIPYGSPDQGISLFGTEGQSWARLKMNQTRYIKINNNDNQKKAEQIKKIIKYGAGNCGEFSAITYMLLANLNLSENIHRVRSQDYDHSFCIVGDVEDNKSIVVDTWPIVPSVHFLDDCIFSVDEVLWTHKIEDSFPLSIESAYQISRSTNKEVLDFIQRTRNVKNENEYLEFASRDPLANKFFNHFFSENHPMTIFQKKETGEMLCSRMPRRYAEQQQIFIEKYQHIQGTE